MREPIARCLAELSAADVADRCSDAAVAVLPIGAVEQHGPHLPLSTDLLVADELCRRVVDARGEELDLWLLPSLAYSKSNEHAWAPGTFWLSSTTMLHLLDDLARSLRLTPIRKLAVVNGHGGNSSLLDVACRDIRVHHGLLTFLLHTVLPPDQGGPASAHELGLGIHGGEDETTLVLHLAPELVDMRRAERIVPEWLTTYRHIGIGGPVRFGWSSDDLSSTGVIGDPSQASPEKGAALFGGMVDTLGQQLAEVARFEFEDKTGDDAERG
jgi:creatinine amidohydrolase